MFSPTLKKGSAELLILSLLEARERHGYEVAKLIEERSGGRLSFQASSLYPVLFRMEKRGWIKGTWVEKEGERRRRFYRLTAKGERALAAQRRTWREFTLAVNLVVEPSHA
ncbi:MAG: PadR family transcriptional regulator [Gemmatimonadetes bacterium]|nr:PadR family transcriptional regulator [Gemmatimonadota bacterium]